MDPCPPTRMLEEFAAGACADDTVGAHVGGCDECRAAVEECRENNLFLAGVRTALAAHEAGGSSAEGGPDSMSPGMVAGYQIEEELYRGGQGVVYRAVQTRTRRTVAIKMLLSERRATGRQKERFEREIRIAAGLRHPNIVAVHDSGYISDGRYGLVMEYIDGVPLDRWSRDLDTSRGREARRAALRTRLGLMAKVCDGVLCAHQHSIVHRDLKPANILVDAAGEPHILDFGIARDTGPEQRTRLTHTGEFAGTLAYASPEQVSGDLSKVDTRTDIYSLGVIMYELVSGRMPYAVDGPMSQVLQNIESAEPAPLHRRSREPDSPWADGEVSTIILKALAKDPARRYQTAAGLGIDINRYLAGEAIEARRDSTWYVVRKAAARHRVVVAATGLIFFLLTAFGAAMAWQAHRLEIRGTELARALSASHVDRGRSLAAAGQAPLAEDLVFPELIKAGVRRIDGPDVGFAGSSEALHAYWGLWDIFRSSRCVATLGTHVENPTLPQPFPTPDWPAVKLVYFDQDGRRLNALDGLGRLRSWMVATWEQDREKSLFKPVDKVSFRFARSPGGSIAVFGAGKIRVFNPETGSLEAEMDDPDEQAVTGEFSPDGTLMATIGCGFQLRVRDATSLATIVMTADGRAVDPTAIPRSKPSFSLDGRRVAASRDDASIGVWNTVSGSLERSLRPPASLVEKYRSKFVRFGRLAVAPDGTMASFFGLNLIVWSSDGGEPRDLGEPGGTLTNLAFLSGSNGMKLVTTGSTPGGGGGITVIWDVATGVREATFNHPDDSLAMTTSPDGQLVVAGMSNGMVQVYGADPEPHVTALQVGRIWPFPKMALSPDGRTLAITTQEGSESDHEVFLIDLKTRATISRFHQAGPEFIALEFSRDGLSLFESDRSGRIVQRDLASGLQMRQFAFPSDSSGAEPRLLNAAMGGTNQLRLSPDGRILATGRDDGMIGLWDVPSGNWLGVLDSGLRESVVIDFGADGSTLAAQHNESMVVWDLSARRPKLTLPTKGYPACVRCSPAGPVIARSTGGRINFLNTDTGQVSGVTAANTSGMAEAFHSGGAVFFATAWDVSVRLWDVRTGGELISLQKHSQFTRELVVSRDGSTLISSDWPGTVLVWDLTYYNDRIRRELASRITRAAGP